MMEYEDHCEVRDEIEAAGDEAGAGTARAATAAVPRAGVGAAHTLRPDSHRDCRQNGRGFEACLACLLGGSAAAADSDFFEAKVRPVLAANCYGCHTSTQMGGLQLDYADELKGGKPDPPSSPAIPMGVC